MEVVLAECVRALVLHEEFTFERALPSGGVTVGKHRTTYDCFLQALLYLRCLPISPYTDTISRTNTYAHK